MMTGNGQSDTSASVACVVTFEPDLPRLGPVLAAVGAQCPTLVIDNGSVDQAGIASLVAETSSATMLKWPTNMGLGRAFNVAIEFARDRAADYVLLLDQDTIVPEGYVSELELVMEKDQQIACVAGMPVDHRADELGVRESRRARLVQSSGGLFRLTAFAEVGTFDEHLFIHHVDKEWFFRLKDVGRRTEVIDRLRLDHQPGRSVSRIPFTPRVWRWQSDRRLHYVLRNTLLLRKRAHVPRLWWCWQMTKSMVLVVVHLAVRPGRRSRVRAIATAVRSGCKGETA